MLRLNSHDIDDASGEALARPVRWSLIIVALSVAAMLWLLGNVSFAGLDRLLPEGQPFLPYFTT